MKLLFVDCCISQRGAASRTKALAAAFLETFRQSLRGPDRDCGLGGFGAEALYGGYAGPAGCPGCGGRWDAPIFDLARQFRGADAVAVAAPFWDLSFPAALRVYVEHISANGLTYHYEADGCHGDCAARRLVYLTAGGGFEREDSLGVLYWRQLAAMFGIPCFDYVFAGGLDVAGMEAGKLLDGACRLARQLAAED